MVARLRNSHGGGGLVAGKDVSGPSYICTQVINSHPVNLTTTTTTTNSTDQTYILQTPIVASTRMRQKRRV